MFRPLRKQTEKPAKTTPKNIECGEKASIMYRKAGNHFKMAKNWSAAGNAFLQSATYREIPYDSCMDYVEAANCYRKVEPERGLECFIKAAEIQTDNGKFQQVAKYHQEIGMMLESMGRTSQAVEYYESAAQHFRSETKTI